MSAPASVIRCFVAVYPDAEALRRIGEVVHCYRERHPRVRWEEPSHIHITLKFIGSVRRETMRAVAETLRAHAPLREPIDFEIDRPGAFPSFRHPRIVWLGASRPHPAVAALFRAVEDACAPAGVMRETKIFTPHFTIGRMKDGFGGNLQKDLDPCSFEPIPVRFTALRFMESALTPQGAVHTEFARVDFAV